MADLEAHHGRHHPAEPRVALDPVHAVGGDGTDGDEVKVHVGPALQVEDDHPPDVGERVGVRVERVVVGAGEGVLKFGAMSVSRFGNEV